MTDQDNYGLTTAQILYRLPDYNSVLQTYIWQEYDIFPRFPLLKEFLAYWYKRLDGPLHSVYVAHRKIITPNGVIAVDKSFLFH